MKKPFRVTAAVYLVLASFLLTLAACSTPAGRTSGQVVDDGAISSKVKAKLLNDSITGGIAVSVETFRGEVTLTGAVDDNKQKSRAEELAKSVDGVQKVNNLLMLKSG